MTVQVQCKSFAEIMNTDLMQGNQNNSQDCWIVLIVSLVFIIGFYKLSRLILRLLAPLSWFPLDLHKRYAAVQGKSWALITGGSQGIGLAFGQQLAKKNFSIILISRSQTKLRQAKESILKINPNIQVQYVPVDLEKLRTAQQYQDLAKSFDKYDVSVLVNNVGYLNPFKYLDNTYQQIKREAVLNLLPITCLTRLFLPKMLERNKKFGKKSAIINISSGVAQSVVSDSSHYCATKAFDDLFTRSLQEQYRKDSVDFVSVRPYLVTSSMTRNQKSAIHVSANQCAKGALKDLGRYNVSYGHFSHRIQGVIVEQFNGKIINKILCLIIRDLSEKYKELQRKQN